MLPKLRTADADALVVIFYLYRQRTGSDTDAVIMRIAQLTVQCFVPCVLCVVLILADTLDNAIRGPGSQSFGRGSFALPCLSTLYANALLTTLNAFVAQIPARSLTD